MPERADPVGPRRIRVRGGHAAAGDFPTAAWLGAAARALPAPLRARRNEAMRAQLVHLSGPWRGKTVTYRVERLAIGSAADATVRVSGPGVVADHAEIRFDRDGCTFHLSARGGQVFVNHAEVREVILEHGDLLEFGRGGPKARFRIHAEPGAVCKPVRTMLADAREVRRESGLVASTQAMALDLLTHASWQLKVGFPLLVLGTAALVGFFGGWWGGGRSARKVEDEHSRRVDDAVATMRAELERFRSAHADTVSREEIDTLRIEFAARAAVVDRLVASDRALERIHDEYSRGVCLLHGVYVLRRPSGGGVSYLTGSDGARVEIEYTGSGFLASADGWIVTNRHVARPWEFEPELAPLLQLGFEPEFVRLAATFPRLAPVPIDPAQVRVRSDELDVAAVKIAPIADVPVLPLATADPLALRGQDVVVLGYPTGVNALLAKADPAVSERVTSGAATLASIIDGLAGSGAISPVITRGSLNEVLQHKLVYDAETTIGGSGGPVFARDGTVIGVNFAIMPDFTGSNFGVPICFVRELL
jgi:S1-C subfamily serine protease